MNCIELGCVVVWFACGVAGAAYLRHYLGLIGLPVGFLGGVGVAYGAYWLFLSTLNWWMPELPRCLCGNSGPDAYEFERWGEDKDGSVHPTEEWEKDSIGLVERCRRCGRRYLKTPRRFRLVLPDGSLRPYLMHTTFGRWKPEKEQGFQETNSG